MVAIWPGYEPPPLQAGCGDRFGMVLPIDAPTPRAYAERYDIAPDQPRPKPFCPDLEADMRDRLVEIGKGGTFVKVHAKSEDPTIVQWGFEYLLKKFFRRRADAPTPSGNSWNAMEPGQLPGLQGGRGKVVDMLETDENDEDGPDDPKGDD